jgi:hypothetical protein
MIEIIFGKLWQNVERARAVNESNITDVNATKNTFWTLILALKEEGCFLR